MRDVYWGYWLIVLGVFIFVIMMFTQTVTTSNTQDYYQLKEVTEASLYESVDYAYYRMYGELKINKEKFVENFIKRFADTVNLTNEYTLSFYDLYECPPKVTVRVTSNAGTFFISHSNTVASVTNTISSIIEKSDAGGEGSLQECTYGK